MSDDMEGRFFFSVSSEIEPPHIWPARPGMKHMASFDQKIDKLEIRRGRVCVSVGGMWHIVPVPGDE